MTAHGSHTGPLAGIRVVELSGIGPVPHAGMLLADLGADVVRIEPPTGSAPQGVGLNHDPTRRRKTIQNHNLKEQAGFAAVQTLIDESDVLLEGSRPGAIERLGLGPQACLARNPRLIYARMTGWGQDGPLAQSAGHDINYLAVSGVLHGLGQAESQPQFPLNLLGDYGGGSLYLVAGVLAALVQRGLTGEGQVVDAAIINGSTHLMANAMWMRNHGLQSDVRGENILDGGAPFYQVYRTLDGRHLAVGALEPKFFAILVSKTGIDFDVRNQHNTALWPGLRMLLDEAFAAHTLEHWSSVFYGSDACVTPILTLAEAGQHPQVQARQAIDISDSGFFSPGLPLRFSGEEV